MMQMLVSLVPLTDTPEAQPRSGSEHLHLWKHHHKVLIKISTYLITSPITLAIASPRVVTQCVVPDVVPACNSKFAEYMCT
jgi:hypothetical protein